MHRLDVQTFFGATGVQFTDYGGDNDAGIQLVFHENAQTERQALRHVANSVEQHKIHWIIHDGTNWSVDLDELKKLVSTLENCLWATGRVFATPVFDVHDNPFGRSLTYNGWVNIEITPRMVQEQSKANRQPTSDGTLPAMEKRYQVFVSSTFTDLEEARRKAAWALQAIDCIPAGMELFPASNDDPWTIIKRVLDDCDYYLLILAGRYGSLDSDGVGFTEKEYDYAVKTGKPILSFLFDKPLSLPGDKLEQSDESRRKLETFRQKVQSGRTITKWTTSEDLAARISTSMHQELKKGQAEGWVKGRFAEGSDEVARLRKRVLELEKQLEVAQSRQSHAPIEWPVEAVQLLREAEKSQSGRILVTEFSGAFRVQAGEFVFEDNDDRRKVAMYRSLVKKMSTAGLIRTITDGLFELTDEGYNYLGESTESIVPIVDIVDLGLSRKGTGFWSVKPNYEGRTYRINPSICLTNGSVCEVWACELAEMTGNGTFECDQNASTIKFEPSSKSWYIRGTEPLFPGRNTLLMPSGLDFRLCLQEETRNIELLLKVYASSSPPLERRFSFTVEFGDLWPA